MALTVTQTFADGKLRMARSPLIVTMIEDNIIVQDPSYRFLIEVRAWNGAIASIPVEANITLSAIPDPDYRGLFNVEPVVQDIIKAESPLSTETYGSAGSWAIQLKYGYTHNGSKTWVQNSTTTFFTDGFAYAPNPINEYTFFDEINDGNTWLTPTKVVEIGDVYPQWVHMYRGQEQNRGVYYKDDSGEQYLWLFNLPVPVNSEEVIGRAPIGLETVMANRLVGPDPNQNFNPKKYFECSLIDLSDFSIVDRFQVNINPKPFCDVDDDCIAYINRFGVWDYVYMKGAVKESLSQTRTEWNRRVTEFDANVLTYPQGTSQVGVTDVKGSKMWETRTGYVTEDINPKMEDLMLSKTHYSSRLGQFLNLKSKNLSLMKTYQSDLIEYTVQFEIAGNMIQNIQ